MAQAPTEGLKLPAQKVAVSYQRVSTTDQDHYRQKRARDKWLAKHPEYELLETRAVHMSGRKKNRFDWLIKDPVKYPAGTVLLVEDIDRFSRMEVEDGIRELLAMFDRGLGIAVCPYEDDAYSDWELLGVITSFNRGGKTVFAALERARHESERKRERRLGGYDKKWDAIAEGNFSAAFTPRTSQGAMDYPFWLDFAPKENGGLGAFKFNKHRALIDRIFELAKEMGGDRIAKVLRDEGFTSPNPHKGKPKPLSAEAVRKHLAHRAVVGEFQPRHRDNSPARPPIAGVFPQVLTEVEWRAIRQTIADRSTGLGATRSKKGHNLFEKRCFCANCGHVVGFQTQSPKTLANGRVYAYPGKLLCRHGAKFPDECNVNGKQISTPYDEEALLEMLHDYRWEDRYSSTAHDQEVNQARQHVLALESTRGVKQRIVDNIKQGIKSALMDGQAPNPTFAETQKAAELELIEAENAVAIAENRLHALQIKTVGKEAARQARQRVKLFMDSGRKDREEREKFNSWFHTTGLVVLVDPRTKRIEIGPGKVVGTELVEFWDSEWILEHLTAEDRERYLADVEKFKGTGEMVS